MTKLAGTRSAAIAKATAIEAGRGLARALARQAGDGGAAAADGAIAGDDATAANEEDGLDSLHELQPGEHVNYVALLRDWAFVGRGEQMPPSGDWRTWLMLGGRGSGKTRAGAEWAHGLASQGNGPRDLRIALIAETLGDAREVMIDGVSGICRVARRNRPEFEVSRRRLVWPTGAVAQIFSSEHPESLREPQFHYAWCDELHFMISCTVLTCRRSRRLWPRLYGRKRRGNPIVQARLERVAQVISHVDWSPKTVSERQKKRTNILMENWEIDQV